MIGVQELRHDPTTNSTPGVESPPLTFRCGCRPMATPPHLDCEAGLTDLCLLRHGGQSACITAGATAAAETTGHSAGMSEKADGAREGLDESRGTCLTNKEKHSRMMNRFGTKVVSARSACHRGQYLVRERGLVHLS